MSIGGDYPSPINVNGFQCWNCAAVAEAKKDIDPNHPQAGPASENSKAKSVGEKAASGSTSRDAPQTPNPNQTSAVVFGGVLTNATMASNGSGSTPSPTPYSTGNLVSISV
jgi:hypothetical protein